MNSSSSFPLKLFDLVTNESDDIVTWSERGLGFIIVDSKRFASETVPKHFRHSKMSSFQRQLNLYGFQRVAKGHDSGSYYHPQFQRGRPELVSGVKRLPQRKTKAISPSSSSHPAANTTKNVTSNVLTMRSKLLSLSERARSGARPPLIRVHCISSRYEAKNVMKLLKEKQNKDPDKKMPAISKLTRNLLGLPVPQEEGSVQTSDSNDDVTRRSVTDYRYSPRSESIEQKPDLQDGLKIYRYCSWSPVDKAATATDELHHQHLPRPLSSAQQLQSFKAPDRRLDAAVPTTSMKSAPKRPSDSQVPTQNLDKVNGKSGAAPPQFTGGRDKELGPQQPPRQVQALPRKLNLKFRSQTAFNAPSQTNDADKSPGNDVQQC